MLAYVGGAVVGALYVCLSSRTIILSRVTGSRSQSKLTLGGCSSQALRVSYTKLVKLAHAPEVDHISGPKHG